jgi:hypothetical protein
LTSLPNSGCAISGRGIRVLHSGRESGCPTLVGNPGAPFWSRIRVPILVENPGAPF